jgi:hypothetical protein
MLALAWNGYSASPPIVGHQRPLPPQRNSLGRLSSPEISSHRVVMSDNPFAPQLRRRRITMQRASLLRVSRKQGADVRQFWSERPLKKSGGDDETQLATSAVTVRPSTEAHKESGGCACGCRQPLALLGRVGRFLCNERRLRKGIEKRAVNGTSQC